MKQALGAEAAGIGQIPSRTTVPVVIVLLVLALLLAGRLWWLPAHAPLDVNEGWNAMQAMRAFGPGTLYPSPQALTANNYPPLSFLLVGGLGQLLGDDVLAGRLVSLAAEVATGVGVFAMVARLAGNRRWAGAGALLFAGFALTMLRGYTAMNDPQWLAEALATWGLVIVLPARAGASVPPGRAALAGLLAALALLTKHNAIVLPCVTACWLWRHDRRLLLIWAAAAAGVLAGAAVAMFAWWGDAPFLGILRDGRSYSLSRMLSKGGPNLLVLLPGLVACLPLLARRREAIGLVPILLLGIAVPIGLLQRAGDGVDVNAFFEAVIALSVAVPIACAVSPARAGWRLGLAALPILGLLPFAARDSLRDLAGRNAAVDRWGGLIARVAATPGPVGCDDQAVCYWAGRDAGLDFFLLKQRLLKDAHLPLEQAIGQRHFALIEMRTDDTSWHADRLRPMILRHYRITYRSGDRALLVPINQG